MSKVFDYNAFCNNLHTSKANKETYRHRSLSCLGREFGISKATMSRAFKGMPLDLDTAITLCFYFDLNINDYSKL